MKRTIAKTTLSRRDWLKLALVAGAAPTWMRTGRADPPETLLTRRIPTTDERLPAVGLGSSDEFETGDGQSLGPLGEVLRRFVAMGGAVVDTAPIYGNAETVIGKLIAELDIADQLFVATKVRSRGAEAGLDQMEASQRKLGVKPLDLMQVHSLVDVRTQLANLRQWKDTGRVRYIGITHHKTAAHDDLEQLMRDEPLDFVQLNYSVTEPQAERRLLPLATDKGIAVLTNRPFENGALFKRVDDRALPDWAAEFDCQSWAQFSLKYILANPAVTCAIPATSNPEHLADNMRAGLGRLPDKRTRARMRAYMAELWRRPPRA